ncbi:hypothetical protein PtrV1_00027 [Pyrenophora tritici-repentis]|nr:hypothetical protein PtrV1_00027 [Pyrenophora tritici-repentis]
MYRLDPTSAQLGPNAIQPGEFFRAGSLDH